jgi:SAM-dependent methyltransferase
VAGFYAWRRKVVESFVAAAIPDGGLIIDIGCGTAEVLNYLPPNVEYIGFDRSQGYLNKARARYAHRNARFHCEELSPHFTLRGRRADAILAFGLIHHLDDAMSSDLFRVAKKMLGVNGFLLTLDPVYVDGQSAVARYIISKDRGTAVRTERAYKELACREFSSVETYIDSSPVYIP